LTQPCYEQAIWKKSYVPLPSSDERYSFLCALSQKVKLAAEVDLHAIAHKRRLRGIVAGGRPCRSSESVLRRTDPKLGNDDGEDDDDKKKIEWKTETSLQINRSSLLICTRTCLTIRVDERSSAV
jgi:hypothetical protein